MAARLAPGEYDQLHHFVAAGVSDAAPLEVELLVQADRLVGGEDGVLVIDRLSKSRSATGIPTATFSAKVVLVFQAFRFQVIQRTLPPRVVTVPALARNH